MLKVNAALCKSCYYIFLKWEALLRQSIEYKLFEAILSEVLANHKVKELVDYLRLAVQFNDFKAFERLAFVNSIEFIFELIKDPWYRS